MKYLNANNFYRQKFGKRMYKAAVSLATTCPNRDGKCGLGGCAFCSSEGSGEFASSVTDSVTKQIDDAISKVSHKVSGDTGFIAYFQSYTSTYVPINKLCSALEEAARHPKVQGISIATRPDCLGEDVIKVLVDISKTISLSVELGLQTSSDVVAESFGRGYKTEVYSEAVSRLRNEGIEVVTHLIFGLPGETREDMMESVKFAVGAGTDCLKFTCLFVLEGTSYAQKWREGNIVPLEIEEYFDIVEQALEYIPQDMPLLRITGDGPKKILLAPLWTANKRAVVNYINRRFGQ